MDMTTMQSGKKISRAIWLKAFLMGFSAAVVAQQTTAAQPPLDPTIPGQVIAQKARSPGNHPEPASRTAKGNFIPKEKISADSAVAFPVDI